jgi:hypothetical protein
MASELQMAHVRQQVSLSLFEDWKDFQEFQPRAQHEEGLETLFDQLESWTAAMRTVRA